ncbi:MAG: hypothetical protein H0U57_09875 [Tatlockia sp.]|nr:hypothetical protein [Tatlockia sp.]
MPFLIKGSAKQVFTTLGLEKFAEANDKSPDAIAKDIGRSPFWGNLKESKLFTNTWLNQKLSPSQYYVQGNMTAENVRLGFGPIIPTPFYLPGETEADLLTIQKQIKTLPIAYLDDQGACCSLSLYYRQDDPGKWIISQVKNTNLAPDERETMIFTSFDPRPFCQKSEATISSTTFPNEEFLNQIGSVRLSTVMRFILNSDQKIAKNAKIINLFLQYLPLKTNSYENEKLNEAVSNHLPQILANKALEILNDYNQQPLAKQILDCLNENSPLNELILKFPFTGDRNIDARQLRVLLFLDSYNLNSKQDLRLNEDFLRGLDEVLFTENLEFLAASLKEELKTECLVFLMKTSNFRTYFQQIIEVAEKGGFWFKLKDLSLKTWSFPEDAFRHALICKVLCNIPTIPNYELSSLLKMLESNTVLEEFFDPIDLANYITQKGTKGLTILEEVKIYFSDMIPKYKEAAAWRQMPLAPSFLSMIAEQYLQEPNNKLLSEISFCSEPGEIKACTILYEQGVGIDLIKAYIKMPDFVYFVSTLKSFGLKMHLPSLFEGNAMLALKKISSLKNHYEKIATLFLVAQKQLKPEEYFNLVNSFQDYPKLAKLIVSAHEKGFTAKELKKLAFNEAMHRPANLLERYEISFNFKNLSPFVCQTLLFISELSLTEKDNPIIQAYLNDALAASITFFAGECTFNQAISLLNQVLNYPLLANDKTMKVKKLDIFLKQQMQLYKEARELDIPEDMLLVNRKEFANELASAFKVLKTLKAEAEVYKTVCEGFLKLPSDARIKEELINSAIEALLYCAKEAPTEPLIPFELFMENHKLARAISCAAAHQLPGRQLLSCDTSINGEIIAALNKLNRLAQTNKRVFELAISENRKGHDFRLLLAKLPFRAENFLLDFIQRGLDERREKRVAQLPNSAIKNLASQLDESLLLINRLRALDLDCEVINFLVKDDQKSRYFYKAVRKIEAESENIKTRLAKEHPHKLKALERPEADYRKNLYLALYEGLRPDSEIEAGEKAANLTLRIKNAEQAILTPLQIDQDECARWIKAALVNFATIALTIFTLGAGWYLHEQHYKKTGDFFFFTSTRSEEAYKIINNETLEETIEVMNKLN